MTARDLRVESELLSFLTCANHHSNALEHYTYHFGFNKHTQYECSVFTKYPELLSHRLDSAEDIAGVSIRRCYLRGQNFVAVGSVKPVIATLDLHVISVPKAKKKPKKKK